MERLFSTHVIRRQTEPDSLWDFCTIDENGNRGKTQKMLVPSCWENNPEYADYKGKAIYKTSAYFGGNVRLVFKGVSHTAKVSCDGVKVAQHYNAYTGFDAIFASEYDWHTIEVEVDNSFSDNSALHVDNDYYTYGGITRPVFIELLSDVYIRNIHFTPMRQGDKWKAGISATVCNLSDKERMVEFAVSIGSEQVPVQKFNVPAKSKKAVAYEHIMQAEEYSCENPVLYTMHATLASDGNFIDDLAERIGFREITTDGRKILINGKELKIKGFNRHEDSQFGCSVPTELMYKDIELMKEMGANCVRTSHYPNDERFLDMCDENGILVWEEAHARGLSEKQLRNKNFAKQSEDCIREMITEHYNHPSIFIWGVMNECSTYTEFGSVCCKNQLEQIGSLDNTRLKTYASCYPGKDKCMEYADVISFNIYPGWYNNDTAKDNLEELKEWIAQKNQENKPLIISETGAGGIYGYRTETAVHWSEERQAQILENQVGAVLNDDECSGVFIWMLSDCRIEDGKFALSRPKTQNNKGVTDIYRRKKKAFDSIKKLFWDNN